MAVHTLSLDLDNTIRDQIGSIIRAARRRYGLTCGCVLSRADFNCWDPPLGNILGVDNREFTRWAWTDPLICAEARPIPGVIPALRRLASTYRLVVTTATACPQLTEPWLQRWNVPYHAVVHTDDKSTVAFDWHIDDAPHVLCALASAGRPVIRFALPWNAHLAAAADAMPVLASWNQIHQIIR